jgi:hypothetical protein
MANDGGGRDDSVQFSLSELVELEEKRRVREARDEQARQANAARERELKEREQAAQAAERARLAAAEIARKQRDDLDEIARREALQKAIVEQARLEVEIRARADERELERRHEIELARLRREGTQRSLASLLGAALFGGAVSAALAALLYLGVLAPAAQRRFLEASDRVGSIERHADDLGRELDEERRAKKALERRASDAEAEVTRLSKLPKSLAPPARSPSRGATRSQSERVAPDVCAPGDPMCPTVGR